MRGFLFLYLLKFAHVARWCLQVFAYTTLAILVRISYRRMHHFVLALYHVNQCMS